MKRKLMAFAFVTGLLIATSCQSTDECEKYHQKMQGTAQSTLIQDEAACDGNQTCLDLMKEIYEDRMAVAENCYRCCVQNLNCETCPAF